MSTSPNDGDQAWPTWPGFPGWLPRDDEDDEDKRGYGYPYIEDGYGYGYPNIFGRKLAESVWQFFGIAAVVLVGLIIIFSLLYYFVVFSIIVIPKSVPELYTTLALTFVSCAISWGLFWLREKFRIIYSLVELAFGIVTTWVSVGSAINGDGKWLIVVAAIYIIVRGLENFNIGSGYKLLRPYRAITKLSQTHTGAQSTGNV